MELYIPCGQWFQAQKCLSDQANRALFSLKGCLFKFGTPPPTLALTIFDCKILPILLYGSEVWGFHPAKDTEKVHNSMMRYILSLYPNTSVIAIRGELGRMSLRVPRFCRIIKYWLRIVKMDKDRLVYKCYDFQIKNIDVEKYNFWAKDVKYLLQSYGFGEVWNHQGDCLFNNI